MFQNDDVEHGKPLVPPLGTTQQAATVETPGLDQVVNGVEIVERGEEEIVNGKDEQIYGVPVDGLNVFDAEIMGMESLFTTACEAVLDGSSMKRS
jgi:hypothetical protein